MVATIDADIDSNYEMKDVSTRELDRCFRLPPTNSPPSQLQHALRNANLELSLERSKHSVEIVAKDEEIRKLRVAQCLLQDENSDLHEQLEEEQGRADELDSALDDALAQLDEQRAEGEAAQNTVRTQAREIANLKVSTSSTPAKAPLTMTRPN